MPRKRLKRQLIPTDKPEEFRIVPGFPDYAASRDGRVFSVKRPSRGFYPLKPKPDKDGYPRRDSAETLSFTSAISWSSFAALKPSDGSSIVKTLNNRCQR